MWVSLRRKTSGKKPQKIPTIHLHRRIFGWSECSGVLKSSHEGWGDVRCMVKPSEFQIALPKTNIFAPKNAGFQ